MSFRELWWFMIDHTYLIAIAAAATAVVLVLMVICTTVILRHVSVGLKTCNTDALNGLNNKMDHLASLVRSAAFTSLRIEAGAVVVAEDLAASIERADASRGPPGTAADAALTTENRAEGK